MESAEEEVDKTHKRAITGPVPTPPLPEGGRERMANGMNGPRAPFPSPPSPLGPSFCLWPIPPPPMGELRESAQIGERGRDGREGDRQNGGGGGRLVDGRDCVVVEVAMFGPQEDGGGW